MNPKIWLSSPHMGGAEMNFIQEAFDDNWVAPLGPNVNGFESDLEQFLGEDVHVAALSSGTAALHLALIQLGVGAGDEVICQSMTFAASANPIVYLGAQAVESAERSGAIRRSCWRRSEITIDVGATAQTNLHAFGIECKD